MVEIRTMAPATNFEMPPPDALRKLRGIVLAAHPWLIGERLADDVEQRQFANAFSARVNFFAPPRSAGLATSTPSSTTRPSFFRSMAPRA